MGTTAEELTETRATAWKGRRYLWLFGLLIPALPFASWGLVQVSGLGVFWWFGVFFAFGLGPIIDTFVGRDSSNPPEEAVAGLEQDRFYRWATYAYLPLQYAGLVMAAWQWADGGLGLVAKLGLAATIGVVSGVGINSAHELGHKKDSLQRWLAKIGLAQTFYGHFFIEHNRGHHVRVATPVDPASSRLGENFYAFWPRSVSGSLHSAWELERKRLDRLGRRPWTLRNDILNAWAISVVLFAALAIAFGSGVLPYLAIQAVLGFSLLEVVNYLEHYGMLRQKEASGRYERVRPEHSWNNNNVASNLVLYNLQRHSDHHANPTRRYPALRDFEEAPQLPSGYLTMIVIAVIPPLWRRVMDHRVLAHYGGDVTRASIQPRKRATILARYGAPEGSAVGDAPAVAA